MPELDMPLEELRVYKGVNPRPADFDKFWEDALAELAAVEPNAEIRPDRFDTPQCTCEHLYFTGTGGARIHARLLRPKPGTPAGEQAPPEGYPAVLRFHGYSGRAGDWTSLMPLAGAGFVVAALDCRGQAGESEDVSRVRGNTLHGHIVRGLEEGPEKLLFRDIFLDTVQLARVIMSIDEVDSTRVGAAGGSQGGALTIACAALEPRITRAVSIFPFLSDYLRVWNMDRDEKAYRELREFFRRYDPTHAQEEEVFNRLGYIDIHHLAPRVKADTLMLVTLMDEVCPPSTQFAAYNSLTAPKRMVLFPDFGHENLPGGEDMVFEHMMGL